MWVLSIIMIVLVINVPRHKASWTATKTTLSRLSSSHPTEDGANDNLTHKKKGLSENRQPQINKGERFARISLPYFSAEK